MGPDKAHAGEDKGGERMITRCDRSTRETRISLELTHPGTGLFQVDMEPSFLTHMLEALVLHGGMDLRGSAQGDLHVDMHHLTEDLGIVMGRCLLEIWPGSPRVRYGHAVIPMDEALVRCAVDLSMRPGAFTSGELPRGSCGGFDGELVLEFARALSNEARITMHLDVLKGVNLHHTVEACFKAMGRALRQALAPAEGTMSTKGAM